MQNLKLLDCTLRDGGYVNDWRFGSLTIRSIVTRLDNAGIDIIECGFLDSSVKYDKNRSIYPDIPSISDTLRTALPKRAMLVAMIDYGTFDHNLLIPKSESVLDGIRLIFKKENIDEALKYARKVKRLGYTLFLNPVAFSSYHTVELLSLVERINDIMPYGMSIVDTYGLMFNYDVEKSITLVDAILSPNIALGYHVHNNLEMANGHDISFINRKLSRIMIVDSSVLGMGKNAGNSRTEVIVAYADKTNLKKVDLDQVLECAYTDIQKFTVPTTWGYSLGNFISAIHDCSPNWIKFLMNKNTLSIQGIRTILSGLPYEKREVSYFSKSIAEQKYLEYMDRYVNDNDTKTKIERIVKNRSILLLCPGKTLQTYRGAIENYIVYKKPIVFTVNFITDIYSADFAFISNTNRYSQMLGKRSELEKIPKLILTSNITVVKELTPDYVVNFKTLYEATQGDNSTGLLITLLKSINVADVTVAGMDGFDEGAIDNSFFDTNMTLAPSENSNETLIAQLKHIKDIDINWLTPSKIKEALINGVGT